MIKRPYHPSQNKLTALQIFFLAGWLLLSHTAVSAQTPAPLPIDQYWQHIQTLQNDIQSLQNESPDTQVDRLTILADSLMEITAVTLANGQTIPIDHSYLHQQLQAKPANLQRIDTLLDTLLTNRNDWPPPQFTTDDLDPLEAILADTAFQYETAEPNALQRAWQNFQRWLLEILYSLFPEGGLTIEGSLLNAILTVFGVIALFLVMGYALRGLTADFASQATLTEEDLDEQSLTADLALERAQTLSDAGDFRTAVRYLYLSSLLLLEERGLLRYDRSMTNRE